VKSLFFDNRHLLFVAITIIAVAGLSAFITIARLEDPRITNRNPIVLTPVPGASADRVESLVTEKLEQALQEIPEIKNIESTSRSGISVLAIELQDDVTAGENDRIFSEIRDQLADAESQLPADAQPPELDDERDPAAFTLIVGLTWQRDTPPRMGMLTRLGEDLADRLRNLDGTEIVRLYGDVDEEVLVTIDQEAAASQGLTARQISAALDRADSKRSAGTLRAEADNFPVEVDGEFATLDRVRSVPLVDGDSQSIAQLGDVAQVNRTWKDPPVEIGVTDGERCVYVAARMDSATQIGDWATQAKAIVNDARASIGDGIGVTTVFDQSDYTTERLRELGFNLLLGVIVVMCVIFLTMGLRASAIVGLAIPLTASAALFGVLMTGGQLHQMSIFGMIIALGLLIDNAIVMTDEIRKRSERGVSPRVAMRETISHLAGPLFASTLTTALAFAPIVLLPGNAGDFVGYIGGSVILAIISSYAISMTIIAALAARYGQFTTAQHRRSWWRHGLPGAALSRFMKRVMALGFRMPVAMIILAALPAIAGFSVGPHLGRQFFPPVDRDMFELRVWLPRQVSIEHTRRTVERIETVIRERDEVERVHWLIGGSFPSVYYNLTMNQDRSPHYAQGIIDATTAESVQRLIAELQAQLDAEFPESQIVLRSFGQGPPVDADVEFRIYGPSVGKLQQLGDDIRRSLSAHHDVLHTRTSLPRGQPNLYVTVNESESILSGFMLGDLSRDLRGQLDGFIGGSIVEDLEELPVRVRTTGPRRTEVAGLGSTSFAAAPDAWTPLAALGTLELRPELGGVTRYNTVRCNIVEGYTREDALPIDVTRDVQQALDARGFELPPGYSIELGGSLEQDQEATANLAIYAPVLATIMLAALILTFRSVFLAGILICVGLLSVGLALLSTWSIGFPVSFNTILGTFGLIGVAFNDSIVVLASIREDPKARAGDPRAIAEAVLGCSRHIISTTLTTIGGFLPLLLLVGGEFWPSLAIVLAGGVGGATLLALLFVPAAYSLLSRIVGRTNDAPMQPS